MANVTLYKQDGSENGKVELNDAIWAVEPNENVVFDAVVMQRVASLGAKRVLVVPAKVQSAARNGVAVGSSSDRPRAAMHTSCQRRFVVWQSNPYFHRRFSIATWSLLTV